MTRIRLAGLFTAFVLAACSEGPQPLPLEPTVSDAAFSAAGAQPDRWIVVFRDGVADPAGEADRLTRTHGGRVLFAYRHALKGFAATLPAPAVEALRNNPNVAYIEPDAAVQLFDTQNNPPAWGIDRIDQLDLPLSDSYTWGPDGAGVTAYVLDTGIRITHTDFGGRAQYMTGGVNGNFVGDGQQNASDCHGHGTHVAGTLGGSAHGVAKNVQIRAGRVVNCQGSGNVSMAIAGVDWIRQNASPPAVVNMSLGYGDVQSLRDAVQNAIAAGIVFAVAAGNGNFAGVPQDACNESPGGAPAALTVGATSITDTEASFSNYGSCVDILAPGVSIQSAYYTSNSATAVFSGTSMASPHVAGAAALVLDANPGFTPAQVAGALIGNATQNTITLHSRSRRNGTANRMLYTGFLNGGGEPVNQPPSAAFAFSCNGLTCNFTDQSMDPDGLVASRSWDFGDGESSSAQSPSHTYDAGDTYVVTLTVTDNDGETDAVSHNVNVSEPTGGISLTVTGYKVRGVQHADLNWSGATGTNVDVYRNEAILDTTANDGAYTHNAGTKGGGSATYRICEAGTTTCSATVTVTY